MFWMGKCLDLMKTHTRQEHCNYVDQEDLLLEYSKPHVTYERVQRSHETKYNSGEWFLFY